MQYSNDKYTILITLWDPIFHFWEAFNVIFWNSIFSYFKIIVSETQTYHTLCSYRYFRKLIYYNHILYIVFFFNPLNAQLNPIRHLLALIGAHHILRVRRIRVNFSVKNIPHTTECTNILPDNEHEMFETCNRHQELILVIDQLEAQNLVL